MNRAKYARVRRARHDKHPRAGRWRWAGVLGLTVVLVGLGGGGSYALLSDTGVLRGGAIMSGDLRASVGDISWKQVTPGVASGASGTLTASPGGFESMPGDVIELRAPVTTFLQGDNLVADLSVTYSTPDVQAVAATFHVEDAKGTRVAPSGSDAAAGGSVSVPGLIGSNAGVSANWTVVVTVEVLGGYQWVTPDSPASTVTWDPGEVRVSLDQVRSPTPGTVTP